MQGKIAIELQQMWKAGLGVEIGLRQIERKIFYSAQSRLDYDLCASSWVGDYDDANTFLDMFISQSGNNRTGWASSRYDELIRKANSLTNAQARAETLQQAESLLLTEETPIVPIYFYGGFMLFRDAEIKGLYPNILDEHPIQDVWKISPKFQVSSPTSQVAGRSVRRPGTWDLEPGTWDFLTDVFP
ncbi:MAG: ABC transporter substrate-binding protein, partial [Limisphaerales bacterium]